MTTIDTKHLRALAEAALSRGTWAEEEHSDAIIIQGSEGCAHDGRALAVAEYVYLAEDRAYIAAIDPPTLIALLDRLEAADQRAAEYAAVVEKVRSVIERESGWFRYRAEPVSAVLAAAPADALREIKAEVWEEGAADGEWNSEHEAMIERGIRGRVENPYREEQS